LNGRDDDVSNGRNGIVLGHGPQGHSIVDDKGHAFSVKVCFYPGFYKVKPAVRTFQALQYGKGAKYARRSGKEKDDKNDEFRPKVPLFNGFYRTFLQRGPHCRERVSDGRIFRPFITV
jgi:hypothetical protein